MRRKTTRFLFSALFVMLMLLLSACNLSSSSLQDVAVSQTAISVLFTQMAATPTLSPTLENLPSPTATLTPTATVPPTPPSPTQIPRPASYTLQLGEYPFCIARRFNVDPKELMSLNNLTSGIIFQPGLVLNIPQTGHPFPVPRALRLHPASYTVPEQMTVYKVACLFGDVDPQAITQVNNLTNPLINAGVILQIP
jgi:LysM repeat protein